MICKPCRKAARSLPSLPTSKNYVLWWHEKCKGGTWCDCQHATVSSLNPEKMK